MDQQPTFARMGSFWLILPVVALVLFLSLMLERKLSQGGRRAALARACVLALLAGYMGIYAWLTFFYRRPTAAPEADLRLLWSYREAFSLQGGLHIARLGLARQILMNILLYTCLGCLLPVAYAGTRRRLLWTVLTALSLSAATEALQYLTRRGLCELDDVLDNLLGCLLGLGLLAAGRALIRRLLGEDG